MATAIAQGLLALAFLGLAFITGVGDGMRRQRESDCHLAGGYTIAIEGRHGCIRAPLKQEP